MNAEAMENRERSDSMESTTATAIALSAQEEATPCGRRGWESDDMHECPRCGQACDCIGDDLWNDLEAEFCECECEWLEDNVDGDDDYDLEATGDE